MAKGIRWNWLAEKGFDVQKDVHQMRYMESLWAPTNEVQAVFCEAKAGTGKTSLAVLAGVYEVEKGNFDRIIYVRNAVSVRDQGFLPGGADEKAAPYMAPLIDAMDKVQPGLFEKWSKPDAIKKIPPRVFTTTTSFSRGITWERSFIIVDETQNFDLDELQAVLTRPTDSCKIVVIGSTRQIDNKKVRRVAGLTPFELYMEHYKGTISAQHQLFTNYRGWFSDHADNIQDTIKKLSQ